MINKIMEKLVRTVVKIIHVCMILDKLNIAKLIYVCLQDVYTGTAQESKLIIVLIDL